jgi:hypothetical protein
VVYAIKSADDREEEFGVYSTRVGVCLGNVRSQISGNSYETPISKGWVG